MPTTNTNLRPRLPVTGFRKFIYRVDSVVNTAAKLEEQINKRAGQGYRLKHSVPNGVNVVLTFERRARKIRA